MQNHELENPQAAPDAGHHNRPGIPKEREPQPLANAHWLYPDRQEPGQAEILHEPNQGLRGTFGSQHPPSGISGLLRRAAYRVPGYRIRRWVMLIAADRIEGVGAAVADVARSPKTWLLLGAGAVLVFVSRGVFKA